jgi:hypothetical protein
MVGLLMPFMIDDLGLICKKKSFPYNKISALVKTLPGGTPHGKEDI